ncbi:hypothetical protein WDV06_01200 [Streptomyces racemochromogenes]|uniref:Uncharacterized protein n=1 Tax=Streptomyces racemochromogenes TaxID=67353 RepID=A0ABW7P5W0_9ACTN
MGTKRPAEGVRAVPAAELREALFAVGGPEVPFRLRQGSAKERADVVAEHRIPELELTVKVRMRLLPVRREVEVITEQWGRLSYEGGSRQYARGSGRRVARQWRFQKGPDGRRRLVESFRYDSRDMTGPLQRTVLEGGWVWREVLFGS